MRIKIAVALNIFGASLAIGLVVAGAVALAAFQELRVGGPVFNRIMQDQGIVADILPPPLYVVEAHLVVMSASAERKGGPELVARLAKLHKEYNERRDYWAASDLGSDIKKIITRESDIAAARFWKAAEKDLVPALAAGDQARIDAAFEAADNAYEAQRVIIDRAVTMATASAAVSEKQSAKETTKAFIQLGIAAALLMVLVAAGIVLMRRGVVQPVQAMTTYMERLAAGEYNRPVPFADRHDEIGEMAKSVEIFRLGLIERAESREREEALKAQAEAAKQAERCVCAMKRLPPASAKTMNGPPQRLPRPLNRPVFLRPRRLSGSVKRRHAPPKTLHGQPRRPAPRLRLRPRP